MNWHTSRLILSSCLLAVALSSCSREQSQVEAEVLHWQTSGREAASVAELKKMLESKPETHARAGENIDLMFDLSTLAFFDPKTEVRIR